MATATAPLPSSSAWIAPKNRITSSSSSSLIVRNGSFLSFQFGTQRDQKKKSLSTSTSYSCELKVVGRRCVVCSAAAASSPSPSLPAALLFDCDGVLVDTEKDGHRVSFNDTFAEVKMSSPFHLVNWVYLVSAFLEGRLHFANWVTFFFFTHSAQ